MILTVGHSTRTLKDFVALLLDHGVNQLVDVRPIPRSQHNPQFNRDRLPRSFEKAGICYQHMAGIGACGTRVVIRSILVGEIPASAASLITGRHLSLTKP
jgi:uncharacterized protein (DUF488 family)